MAEAPASDRPRTFPCDACGADLVFAPGAEALACPYCGFTREIALDADARIEERDLQSALARQAELRSGPGPGADHDHSAVCEACGAEVSFQGRDVTRDCAWCASPVQQRDAHRAEGRLPVDAVVPFAIAQGAARGRVSEWLSGLWFAPNDFLRTDVPERTHGVYLPYFTFDAATFNRYHGERGSVRYRGSGRNRRRTVRWRAVSGVFQHFFDDLPGPADGSLPTALRRALEPWPSERAVPFAPELLAGQLSRTYALPLAEAWKRAQVRIAEALVRRAKTQIGGDEQRVHELATRFDAIAYNHVLLPVYLLAIRHGSKPYRVIINGVTGEVQGERPWSPTKIALAVATALVLLATYCWAR
jgi:predicted RNA-binding Zn-ribbon protein involved in translation (DUF1610 family)